MTRLRMMIDLADGQLTIETVAALDDRGENRRTALGVGCDACSRGVSCHPDLPRSQPITTAKTLFGLPGINLF